jgi:hypothetical protein
MFNITTTGRMLLSTLCCLMFITSPSPLTSAQKNFELATPTNAKRFIGVWKGTFQGNVFLTIVLTAANDKLVGTFSHADIEVSNTGELTKAEAREGVDPIIDLRVNDNILRITTKSTDGSEDSIQSELILTSADEVALRMVLPPDVPRPKPWKLKRTMN